MTQKNLLNRSFTENTLTIPGLTYYELYKKCGNDNNNGCDDEMMLLVMVMTINGLWSVHSVWFNCVDCSNELLLWCSSQSFSRVS